MHAPFAMIVTSRCRITAAQRQPPIKHKPQSALGRPLRTHRLHSSPGIPNIPLCLAPNSGFAARVKAVLGPTNTGKTHLAIERMLAHASGIIGFPLRLLARENYDRMVAIKGARTSP